MTATTIPSTHSPRNTRSSRLLISSRASRPSERVRPRMRVLSFFATDTPKEWRGGGGRHGAANALRSYRRRSARSSRAGRRERPTLFQRDRSANAELRHAAVERGRANAEHFGRASRATHTPSRLLEHRADVIDLDAVERQV